MANCGQACPYNTLDGCKVKEYNAICPLTNMATPVTEYRMTNADRIRAMSNRKLAEFLADKCADASCVKLSDDGYALTETEKKNIWHTWFRTYMQWLQQPAEVEHG